MTDEQCPWDEPAAEPPCNRTHATKGPCQLLLGHVGPCKWKDDVWGKLQGDEDTRL